MQFWAPSQPAARAGSSAASYSWQTTRLAVCSARLRFPATTLPLAPSSTTPSLKTRPARQATPYPRSLTRQARVTFTSTREACSSLRTKWSLQLVQQSVLARTSFSSELATSPSSLTSSACTTFHSTCPTLQGRSSSSRSTSRRRSRGAHKQVRSAGRARRCARTGVRVPLCHRLGVCTNTGT